MHVYSALIVSFLCLFITYGKEIKDRYIPEDVPLVACPVCSFEVRELYRIAEVMRGNAPYKKLTEWHMTPLFDGICDPESKYGHWLRLADIVTAKVNESNERRLEVHMHETRGKCGKECMTIVKSCQLLLEEDLDRDALSAMLYKNTYKNADDIVTKVCTDMTKRCTGKPRYLPSRYKRIDYPFEPLSDQQQKMEYLMEKMKDEGKDMPPLKMYNRDDMKDMVGDFDEEDADEQDEQFTGRQGLEL